MKKVIQHKSKKKLYLIKSYFPPTNTDSTKASSVENGSMIQDPMLEYVDNLQYTWCCTVCGKANTKVIMMTQIQKNYIKGILYHCNHCGALIRSNNPLYMHI